MKEEQEKLVHWADEKEVVKTSAPIKLVLRLFSVCPGWLVRLLSYPIAFFYLLCSKRARVVVKDYQKKLYDYTNGESPKRLSVYKQILSFAFCLMEKAQGWLGQVDLNCVDFRQDDVVPLIEQLEENRGAVIIGSHLGNIELLRSLSSFNKTKVSHNVPVTTIMEINATQSFNRALQEINPNVDFNVINPADITPDTMCKLMEDIEKGGLVVIAGDRTSARSRNKSLVKDFLGVPAEFPYGTFLLAALLKAPIYFMFGLRKKESVFAPRYGIFVEKSKVDFECKRTEREERIGQLCKEYVEKLEKYCKEFPYQWYNFFNFWLRQSG